MRVPAHQRGCHQPGYVARGDHNEFQGADAFVLPAGGMPASHTYLRTALDIGFSTVKPVFEPCFYSHRDARAELDAIPRNPRGANANRVSVLLGNDAFPQTRTVTHTLWAMLGILPAGQIQRASMLKGSAINLDFAVAGKRSSDQDRLRQNRHDRQWAKGGRRRSSRASHRTNQVRSMLPIQDAGVPRISAEHSSEELTDQHNPIQSRPAAIPKQHQAVTALLMRSGPALHQASITSSADSPSCRGARMAPPSGRAIRPLLLSAPSLNRSCPPCRVPDRVKQ